MLGNGKEFCSFFKMNPGLSSVWPEHLPEKQKIASSNPAVPTKSDPVTGIENEEM